MSFEDEHGLKETKKGATKKVKAPIKNSRMDKLMQRKSTVNPAKAAVAIKKRLDTKRRNRSQVGFD